MSKKYDHGQSQAKHACRHELQISKPVLKFKQIQMSIQQFEHANASNKSKKSLILTVWSPEAVRIWVSSCEISQIVKKLALQNNKQIIFSLINHAKL